jgi:hypothetical protein
LTSTATIATTPTEDVPDAFADSRELFQTLVGFLDGAPAAVLTHGDLEVQLDAQGRGLIRQLFQDHLTLRAQTEQNQPRLQVVGADGARHGRVEPGHTRELVTVFGAVQVNRLAYRAPAAANLHPADAALNLPDERQSHGIRRLAAVEAARGSFQESQLAIVRATGQKVGKRQLEQLAARAAVDFEAYYATRQPPVGAPSDLLVLSCDGKGIVMRPEGLRPQTAKAAQDASPKLKTRLSKGEKSNRKRMAEVGAVYDAAPAARTVADIMPSNDTQREAAPAGPAATNKWLIASVEQDAKTVIARIFDEAERRDATHQRTWVVLVDGNRHQLDRIAAEAKARKVTVTVVVDFVHVLEYLWKAAWCFHREADPAAEAWVANKAREILRGHATRVAGAIRRTASNRTLTKTARKGADACAKYLTNLAGHLDYPTALSSGWPIATGIIEGACRHLVKDRMDITGARWGLPGAEAVLKLRALRCNDDFDDYWPLCERSHNCHYARRPIMSWNGDESVIVHVGVGAVDEAVNIILRVAQAF